jgi:hypothetical protein
MAANKHQILGLGHELADMTVHVTDAYDLLITVHGQQFRVSSSLTTDGGLMIRTLNGEELTTSSLTPAILEVGMKK